MRNRIHIMMIVMVTSSLQASSGLLARFKKAVGIKPKQTYQVNSSSSSNMPPPPLRSNAALQGGAGSAGSVQQGASASRRVSTASTSSVDSVGSFELPYSPAGSRVGTVKQASSSGSGPAVHYSRPTPPPPGPVRPVSRRVSTASTSSVDSVGSFELPYSSASSRVGTVKQVPVAAPSTPTRIQSGSLKDLEVSAVPQEGAGSTGTFVPQSGSSSSVSAGAHPALRSSSPVSGGPVRIPKKQGPGVPINPNLGKQITANVTASKQEQDALKAILDGETPSQVIPKAKPPKPEPNPRPLSNPRLRPIKQSPRASQVIGDEDLPPPPPPMDDPIPGSSMTDALLPPPPPPPLPPSLSSVSQQAVSAAHVRRPAANVIGSSAQNGRNELMAAIQKGKTLKPAGDRILKPVASQLSHEEALKKKLDAIKRANNPDDVPENVSADVPDVTPGPVIKIRRPSSVVSNTGSLRAGEIPPPPPLPGTSGAPVIQPGVIPPPPGPAPTPAQLLSGKPIQQQPASPQPTVGRPASPKPASPQPAGRVQISAADLQNVKLKKREQPTSAEKASSSEQSVSNTPARVGGINLNQALEKTAFKNLIRNKRNSTDLDNEDWEA